jgi:predicted nuclease of predicted toxin-antitoxin system
MPTYLADENIPLIAVKALKDMGIHIQSIGEIERGMEDEQILSYAVQNNSIIITFDKDFGELVFRLKRPALGIILLRVPPQSPEFIVSLLSPILSNPQFAPEMKFLVISATHIRSVPLR